MISAVLMALAAAGLFGIGLYTIRAGRLPGPSWLRRARRGVPAWQTGVVLLMLGLSASMLAASELNGWRWWPLIAALGGCVPGVFEGTMLLVRKPTDRAWYRMPPPIEGAGAEENVE